MSTVHKDKGMAGIVTLLNPQHVDPKLDLAGVENKFLNIDTSTIAGDKDELDSNINEINKLAKELNISLEDGVSVATTQKGIGEGLRYLGNESSKGSSSSRDISPRSKSEHPSTVDVPVTTNGRKPPSSVGHNSYRPPLPPADYTPPPMRPTQAHIVPPRASHSKTLTEEQARRGRLDRAVENIAGGSSKNVFSTHVEETLDSKASKLDQIASLKMTLQEEGRPLDDIQHVTLDSSMAEINEVLGLLTLKNNRYRYSTLAEEAITSAAEIMETVFDGTTNIPLLNIAPDYTGYSSTVHTKLHRLRHETSEIVGKMIESHNVSPFNRILMEMLPNLLLYPRIKHKQKASRAVTSLTSTDSRNSFNKMRDKFEDYDISNL